MLVQISLGEIISSILVIIAVATFFYGRNKDKLKLENERGQQTVKNDTMQSGIDENKISIKTINGKIEQHIKDDSKNNDDIRDDLSEIKQELSSIDNELKHLSK